MNHDLKLTIVSASRNDTHGGDIIRRTQIFVNGIFAHAEETQKIVELILVDWNPPGDRPPLYQALQWPKEHPYCTARVIQVPPTLHARYKHASHLPFYQMIAKNVGIRRARGQFILATNIDILFSKELFNFMVSDLVKANKTYRAARLDVNNQVPLEARLEEQLLYCQNNIIRVNHKYGSNNLLTNNYFAIYDLNVDVASNPFNATFSKLFSNACGDFQFMSKENWFSLKGYPEFDSFSMHIDSIFTSIAQFGNAPEEILPEPMHLYHIEHTSGFVPEKYTLGKFEIAKIFPWEIIRQYLTKMMLENKPLVYNEDNWGFEGLILPEEVPVRADWDHDILSSPTISDFKREPGKPGQMTIFTIPQAFVGNNADLQREVIKGWLKLEPRPEVILFGDARGCAEIASELGLRHVPFYEINEYGTPLVSALFDRVQVLATYDVLVYAGSGVVFGSNLPDLIQQASENFSSFTMFDGRQDDNWLVFTRWLWRNIPDFSLGRGAWRQWLFAQALDQKVAVIDTSAVLETTTTAIEPEMVLSNRPRTMVVERLNNLKLSGDIGEPQFIRGNWVITKTGLQSALYSINRS